MFESDETQTGKYDPYVVAIIPAYNEERYIGSVVLKTQEYTDQVIVVDDGSADRTASIAGLAGAQVVRHGVNQCKGTALNTGFRAARSLHPQAIVILDGDGQHLPEEVPCVLAPILAGDADIVVGSRYLRNPCSVPRHRVWGHRAVNLLTDLGSGVSVSDSQSGFRAFSPRAVEAISFSSTGFSVESEMQFLARDHGLRVVEVPITADYTDRPKRSVLNHGLKVLNGVLRLMGQYRPLLFFGVPGLAVLLVGLGWGVHAVDLLPRSQTLAAAYALLGIFLAVLGSLSLFTGITLHSVRGILQDLQGKGHTWHEASDPTAARH